MGGGEAELRYLDGDFEIIKPGTHVLYAVTGQAIALEDLRYWSVARQEAYVNAVASLQAEDDEGAYGNSRAFSLSGVVLGFVGLFFPKFRGTCFSRKIRKIHARRTDPRRAGHTDPATGCARAL